MKTKTKRLKIQLTLPLTRDEAESIMNKLAFVANVQRSLTAARDAEILAINAKYETPLGRIAAELWAKTDALKAWAEANPEEFPKGRKSISFISGILGFRTGTPACKLFSRAFTWDRVKQLLNCATGWASCLRCVTEVDKEEIIARRAHAPDKAEFAHELKRLGLKVTQEEIFYIEPALTNLESRQVTEAKEAA